jgi:hypothetical protein
MATVTGGTGKMTEDPFRVGGAADDAAADAAVRSHFTRVHGAAPATIGRLALGPRQFRMAQAAPGAEVAFYEILPA